MSELKLLCEVRDLHAYLVVRLGIDYGAN